MKECCQHPFNHYTRPLSRYGEIHHHDPPNILDRVTHLDSKRPDAVSSDVRSNLRRLCLCRGTWSLRQKAQTRCGHKKYALRCHSAMVRIDVRSRKKQAVLDTIHEAGPHPRHLDALTHIQIGQMPHKWGLLLLGRLQPTERYWHPKPILTVRIEFGSIPSDVVLGCWIVSVACSNETRAPDLLPWQRGHVRNKSAYPVESFAKTLNSVSELHMDRTHVPQSSLKMLLHHGWRRNLWICMPSIPSSLGALPRSAIHEQPSARCTQNLETASVCTHTHFVG